MAKSDDEFYKLLDSLSQRESSQSPYNIPPTKEEETDFYAALNRLDADRERQKNWESQKGMELVGPPEELAGPPSLWEQALATGKSFNQEAIAGAANTIGSTVAAVGDSPLAMGFDPIGYLTNAAENGKYGSPEMSEQGRIFADTSRSEEAQKIREQAGIPEDSVLASVARSGQSVFPMGLGAAASIAGAPSVGAGIMGLGTAAPAYVEGVDQLGLSGVEAAQRAAIQGGIEAGFERLGLGALTKGGLDSIIGKELAKKIAANYGTKVLGAAAINAGEEVGTTLAQTAADEIAGYKTYTPEEKARGLFDSAVAGALFGGGIRAITATGDPAVDEGIQTADELAKQADRQVAEMLGKNQKSRDEAWFVDLQADKARAVLKSILGKSIYPQITPDGTTRGPTQQEMFGPTPDVPSAQDMFSGELRPIPEQTQEEAATQENKANIIEELKIRRQNEEATIQKAQEALAKKDISDAGKKRAQAKIEKAQGRLAVIQNLEQQINTPTIKDVPRTEQEQRALEQSIPMRTLLADRRRNAGATVPIEEAPVQLELNMPQERAEPLGQPSLFTQEGAVNPEVRQDTQEVQAGQVTSSENLQQPTEAQSDVSGDEQTEVEIALDPEADPESQRAAIEQLYQRDLQETDQRSQEARSISVTESLSPDIKQLVSKGVVRVVGENDTRVQQLLGDKSLSAGGRGFFDGKNLYLRADNIAAGEANAVALHEIKHYMDRQAGNVKRKSLRNILGDEGNSRVISRVEQLANSGNRVAQNALQRAKGLSDYSEELPAYFIEEAALAAQNGSIGRARAVVRDIVSLAKAKLADLGINLNLSENDIYYLGRQLAKEAGKIKQPKVEPTIRQSLDSSRPSQDGLDVEELPFDPELFRQRYLNNNASGESSASLEAIGRIQEEKALGRKRVLVDKYNNARELAGVDAVDMKAGPGEVILQKGIGKDKWTVLSQDNSLSKDVVEGKINVARAKSENKILESRRAAQPKKVEKELKKTAATLNQPITQQKTGRVVKPSPTRDLERKLVRGARTKALEQHTVAPNTPQKIVDATKNALTALFSGNRAGMVDFQNLIENQNGASALTQAEAHQWSNKINNAIAPYKTSQRGEILRLMAATNSDYGTRAAARARREAAWAKLKNDFPSVYAALRDAQVAGRRQSLDLIRQILDSGRPLTKEDVERVKTIHEKLDFYQTEIYAAFIPKVGKTHTESVYKAWKKWAADPKKVPMSDDVRIFENARALIAKNDLDIFDVVDKEKLDPAAGDRSMSMEELIGLHRTWIPESESEAIRLVEMDVDQQNQYRDKLFDELIAKRDELKKLETYDKELFEKSRQTTLEMMGLIGDAVGYIGKRYGLGNMDRSILKEKKNVPPELKDLLGRLVDPIARFEATYIKRGMLLNQMKFIDQMYRDGYGEYFVQEAERSKYGDTFSEKLVGEALGPLNGLYATPRVAAALNTYNQAQMGIENAFKQLLTKGNVSEFTSMTGASVLRVWGKIAGGYKFMKVVLNTPARVPLNLVGSQLAVVQNGVFGTKLPEYEARAHRALMHMIRPESGTLLVTDDNKLTASQRQLKKDVQMLLKHEITDSAQVGELQRTAREVRLADVLGERRKSVARKRGRNIKEVLVNLVGNSDQAGKAIAFFNEMDKLGEFSKALGKSLTEDQIAAFAASRVKETNIQLSRAAPLVKMTDRIGATMFAPYFLQTYTSLYKSLMQATQDIRVGREMQQDSSTKKAGKILSDLGYKRLMGTIATIMANRWTLGATLKVAGATALYSALFGGSGGNDEERKRKALQDAMQQINPGSSTFWVGNSKDGKTAGFIDVGEFSHVDPASATVGAMLDGGTDEALRSVTGLVFTNPGTKSMFQFIGSFFGGKDKNPSLYYTNPAANDAAVEFFHNKLGLDLSVVQTGLNLSTVLPNWMKSKFDYFKDEEERIPGIAQYAQQLGVRPQVFSLDTASMEIRNIYSDFTDSSRNVLSTDKKSFLDEIGTPNPNKEKVEKMYAALLDGEMARFQRARVLVEGAKLGLDVTDDEIVDAIKDATINKEHAADLVDGVFNPRIISNRVLANAARREIERNPEDEDRITRKYDMIAEIVDRLNNTARSE